MYQPGTNKYYTDADDVGTRWAHDASFVGVLPGKQRKCQDLGCGIFFLLCLAGMACMTVFWRSHMDEGVLELEASMNVSDYAHDLEVLQSQKWVLASGVGATAILAFLWIELLKYCTKPLVYGSFFLAVAAMVGVGAVLILGVNNSEIQIHATHATTIAGYVCIACGVLLGAVVCCFRRRISFSCEMIGHAAKGVQSNKGLFLVCTPLFFCLNTAFCYWTVMTLWAFNAQVKDVDCSTMAVGGANECYAMGCAWDATASTCSGDGKTLDTTVRWFMLYVLFMFLWGGFFLAGMAKVVISGTIAMWYFAKDKASTSAFNFGTMLKYALCYHTGSVAKGSFILAVVKFAELMVSAARKDTDNALARFLLCLVECFLRCLENLLRWLTKYAYIYVAMHGQPFMEASKSSRRLFMRSRFCSLFTTDVIANLICNIGMFACVGLVTFGCALYMHSHGTDTYSVTALVLLVLFSCATFWTVGQVVETASSTVMVCFMEDEERHGAMKTFSGGETYYAIQKSAQEHAREDLARNTQGNYGTIH